VTSYVLLRRLIVNNERGPLICTLARITLNYRIVGKLGYMYMAGTRVRCRVRVSRVYSQLGFCCAHG